MNSYKFIYNVVVIGFVVVGTTGWILKADNLRLEQNETKTTSNRDLKPDAAVTIRALLNQQMNDWNQGDLNAFLNGYWKSPKVVFQSGDDRFDGWDLVRERYFKRYGKDAKTMGKLQFEGLEIELLGTSDAFARGRFRLETIDGKKPTGLFTLILHQFPEGWKIIHDHTSTKSS